MTKKIFAMFLAVLMVVSMLPTTVFAAGCPGTGNVHTKSNCSYTKVKVTAPDCGNKGYTTYKCNDCDETFVADWTDPVGEHTWEEAPYVAPTCEKPGSEGGKKCSTCGTVVNATVIPALGTNLKCEYGAWLPANIDCTTGGEQTRTCVHCGNVEKRKVEKSADGHRMSAWELKTPATAEANGLAVKKCLNTNCGYTIEQVVFFDHDHDNTTLSSVAEVAAKCEETGVKAHYECRVCGQKFVYGKASDTATVDTYNMVTDAELLIPTLHDQIKANLNCKTTTYVCNVEGCGKIIKVDAAAAHKYTDWVVLTQPTCTTDGFQKRTCTVCRTDAQTQIIPALGHIEGSWTVPATCTQYGYTYTYCLRQGCVAVKTSETVKIGDKNVSFDLTLGSTVLTQPVVGAGFYLNMYQGNLQKTLYFTGDMDGYYFATSENVADAVKVYLETVKVDGVENAYRMYFYAGSVKNYIAIVKNGTHINAVFGDSYSDKYWTWNDEFDVLTTMVGDKVYNLGTRGDREFSTFSACEISYAAENFLSKMTVSNANGVALLTLTPNTAAGFDNTNHTWKVLSEVPATCLADGVKISYCAAGCGVANKTETQTKYADHQWDEDNVTVVEAADCLNAGKGTVKCKFHEKCGATKEVVIPATGHKPMKENNEIKKFTHAGSHTDLMAYDYNKCENANCPAEKKEINKTNYRAWENAGKLWNTKAEAEAAHGTLTDKNEADVAGDCYVFGYDAYVCSGCSEIVRVKKAGTGAHVFPNGGIVIGEKTYETGYLAPTCTTDGYSINYKCERCGKLIDEAVAENKLTVIPALGHTWKEFTAKERKDLGLGEYVKAPCGTPVYDNYIAYCSVCNPNGVSDLAAAVANKTVKADTKLVEKVVANGALCTATVYELYECHCGETHMRGYLAAGQNVDHEWIEKADATKTPATCTKPGHVDMVCKYCGVDAPEAVEVIPMIPHKNAAGEEFTASCLDDEKVTDRHCVLCCAHKNEKNHDCVNNKNDEGKPAPCDCVIPKNQHAWGEVTYVDSVCGDMPYTSKICSICFKTEAKDAEQFVDEDGKLAPVVGLGHKPVAADADKYGAYTYVPGYKHYTYKWELVEGEEAKYELKQIVDTYEAKFIAYTAPTYTTEGFAKFVCADCGEIIETKLPAISGLGFELEINNANGDKEFTYGSLVEVVVYANGNNVAFNSFNFNLNFANIPVLTCKQELHKHTDDCYKDKELVCKKEEHDKHDSDKCYKLLASDLVYVYSDKDSNKNFNITTSAAANGYIVNVLGTAVRNESGKLQNITIEGKTELVKLYFRVNTMEKKDIVFNFSDAGVGEIKAGQTEPTEKRDFTSVSEKMSIRKFLDFNNDGHFSLVDLMLAESMMTFEHPDGKTYDVTLDINKDGEVTPEELTIAYNFFVGNYKPAELLVMGMTEAEIALMGLNHKVLCNNPECRYELNADWNRCPICGNYQ